MSYDIKNFLNNDDISVLSSGEVFKILQYDRDLSVTPSQAINSYFMQKMDVRKRQAIAVLNGQNTIITQSGAMQWMLGNVHATTGIKGAGDLVGKMFKGKVTGESAIKPEYKGTGIITLEPTYKHIIRINPKDFGGNACIDDGLFLACDGSKTELKIKTRAHISSAAFSGEGLFNLMLQGSGEVLLECAMPLTELITIELNNDTLKLDGNLAIVWSSDLDFTTERAGKTLIGSAASGEGLVNVYRGTGKILMAPVS